MPAANEIYGRVVFVHHGFDEDKVLVRRVQNVLKIFDYFHHISFCVAISAKHIGELGVAPVGDVVVLGISTQDCPFNRVALVVYDENERSQVVAQNRRNLLCSKLERAFAGEQHMASTRRCKKRSQQCASGVADGSHTACEMNVQPWGRVIWPAPMIEVPSSAMITSP